jgi:hypothetical protein
LVYCSQPNVLGNTRFCTICFMSTFIHNCEPFVMSVQL